MVITDVEYFWRLVITYTDGNILRLPFVSYQAAENFALRDGDHVARYYIEAIK